MFETKKNAVVTVRLTPRSAKNAIVSFTEGVICARVTSPPVDGAANNAIIELLSKTLKHRKSAIILVSGESSRIKRFCIEGLSQIDAENRLTTAIRR